MDSSLLHLANVLYLASYSARDILWLRVLTVLAMLCLGGYYWRFDLYSPLAWQGVFLAINLVQIGLLIRERRPVRLTALQKRLHAGPLRTLNPLQIQQLFSLAEPASFAAGECLIRDNTPLECLILILSGEASVRSRGREIARIGEGHFAGEFSFLRGGNTMADVIADGPLRAARWSRADLAALMSRDRDLAVALQAALGIGLVGKLLRSRAAEPEAA